MKIAVKTLGCKLNQAEGDKITQKLIELGFSLVDFKNKADVYIVNSCSVTATADRKAQLIINNFKNKNPKADIILTGCFSKIPRGVDFIIKDKEKLPKELVKIYSFKKPASQPIRQLTNQKTRAFIKIQDGCDNFCSYCIIPFMRGLPKSVSAADIIKEINEKAGQGFKEIVLTGVNICKYKFGKLNLPALARKILKETKIQRIRFGSIDPKLVSNEFIDLFDNKRVCNHLHLSLQSGSDFVLKRMNRKYTTEDFSRLVNKIKEKYPLFGFTTDIIVGFPGETKKEFKETCNFVRKMGFHKIHVFPFSSRPGTVAKKMPGQVDLKTKKSRAENLKKISIELEREFKKKIKGFEFEFLFENKLKNKWIGFSDNYIKVAKKGKNFSVNEIIKTEY